MDRFQLRSSDEIILDAPISADGMRQLSDPGGRTIRVVGTPTRIVVLRNSCDTFGVFYLVAALGGSGEICLRSAPIAPGGKPDWDREWPTYIAMGMDHEGAMEVARRYIRA